MKFFHLSDLHIGLKLINRDLREDQEYILKQITDMAEREKPDAVLIAGDIYDKAVPSAEAVEVFDRFIAGLAAALPDASIMLISGNHDSGPRLNCFRSVLSRQSVYMIGMPPTAPEDHIEKVVLRDEYGRVNFYLLPFVRPSMVRQITGSDENGNVLSYNETLRRLIEREELKVLRSDYKRNDLIKFLSDNGYIILSESDCRKPLDLAADVLVFVPKCYKSTLNIKIHSRIQHISRDAKCVFLISDKCHDVFLVDKRLIYENDESIIKLFSIIKDYLINL